MFTASQAAQPIAAAAKRNSSSISPAAISVSARSPRGQQFGARTSPKATSGISNGSFNSATTPSLPSRSQIEAAGQSQTSTRRRSSQENNKQSSSDDDDEDILDVEVMDASIPPLGMENRQIAWQCGTCKYCVLAMDNKGKTLPISMNAWGEPIPLQCPRCLVSHTNWSVTSPFDSYGDHVNVKGTFANSLQFRQHNAHYGLPPRAPSPPPQLANTSCGAQSTSGGNNDAQRLSTTGGSSRPPLGATLLENLPPILANIGLVTYRGGVPRSTVAVVPPQRKQRTAYFCGLCSRRLLRMDHNGDLVPLDTNAGGEILPLTCPGCGVSHGDWPIRPA
ncbi:Hypothetical protein, putative [Bodo saltans]|uniref:Uncharacterized protein n=1 Tax=Bodo saltans TaxID=75058 RepID=A0A0S4IUB2_BODSA|nr:Hypothetical protein, putative [Bodo saltans]|eukprot:CUF95848.1 Hypothetical protein, putative [Bodo saltans]